MDCHICNKKLCEDKTISFNKERIHKSCLPEEYKDTPEFSLNGVMDSKNWCKYYKNPNCAICAGPLSDETVKDHDH